MKLTEAIKHIQWRFGNFQKLNISEKDIEAINSLIQFANDQISENIHNNQVAYKLYLNEFIEQMKRYKATVFDNIPQKELNRFIDKPLEWHEQRFTDFLNDSEVDMVTDGLGAEHIKDLSRETVDDYIRKIKEGYEAFSMEEVSSNMRMMFSETLRTFS